MNFFSMVNPHPFTGLDIPQPSVYVFPILSVELKTSDQFMREDGQQERG
jgi:hypothetical protein